MCCLHYERVTNWTQLLCIHSAAQCHVTVSHHWPSNLIANIMKIFVNALHQYRLWALVVRTSGRKKLHLKHFINVHNHLAAQDILISKVFSYTMQQMGHVNSFFILVLQALCTFTLKLHQYRLTENASIGLYDFQTKKNSHLLRCK